MLFHQISSSDVHPGDHLYRWRNLKLLQGIAVQRDDDTSQIFVVMSNGLNSFRLVTISQFQGRGILRRALYDQGDTYLHWIKLSGTSFIQKKRPAAEIVQNAFLLLDTMNENPECIPELFVHHFAKLCCTTSHEQWRTYLQKNGTTTPVNEHIIKELEEEIETLKDKQCCPICMDRSNDIAFPCGHLACSTCAQTLDVCHICRQNIPHKINLFWS